jgi:uncharacterized membrane protein YjjP (DUF1212 family)
MPSPEADQLITLGVKAGSLLVQSGAETYRVEDTVQRMLSACGAEAPSVVALTTAIFVTFTYEGRFVSSNQRIGRRTINLQRVADINALSRELAGQPHSRPGEALSRLELIADSRPIFSYWVQLACASVSGAAFCLLFGGSWVDSEVAVLASCLVYLVFSVCNRIGLVRFISTFVGGAAAAAVSIAAVSLLPAINMEPLTIGAIMALVPGVLLTNGVRDIMSDDLLSGVTRLSEAGLAAAGLAAGVVAILSLVVR